MGVTTAGKTKVLETLSSNITHTALQSASGEFFRKAASELTVDGDTLIVDTFLDETDANDTAVTAVDLYGWGATGTLESGTQFSTNAASFTKTSAETLTVSAEIQIVEV